MRVLSSVLIVSLLLRWANDDDAGFYWGKPCCWLKACGVVERDVGNRNVLFLPKGPKIFAFVRISLAMQYKNSVAVWRYYIVDSDVPETTSDAIAGGEVVQLLLKSDFLLHLLKQSQRMKQHILINPK